MARLFRKIGRYHIHHLYKHETVSLCWELLPQFPADGERKMLIFYTQVKYLRRKLWMTNYVIS